MTSPRAERRREQAVWAGVAAGDPKAVYALVQVEARRAALLGLDMPVRTEIAIENIETRRRVRLVAGLETATDEELAADQFEHLAGVLREALAADLERTMDVIATAGLVVGPSDELRRAHRHAG